MRVKCNDGKIREFMPPEDFSSSLKAYNGPSVKMTDIGVKKILPRYAYCNHCKENFPKIKSLTQQKEELRSHTCNGQIDQDKYNELLDRGFIRR